MYPPRSSSGRYSLLPTDQESGAYKPSLTFNVKGRLLPYFKTLRYIGYVVIALLLFLMYKVWTKPLWTEGTFMLQETEKPLYLNTASEKPLVVRLAIISRADEFEIREAMRSAMLAGISSKDVELDYRFFVGKPAGWKKWWTNRRLKEELTTHRDVELLPKISDIKRRISEKRFAALKWMGSVSRHRYDYSMTIDSDTFCRFSTLVRRLQHLHPGLNPREEPILLGRMSVHLMYWENQVPDGEKDPVQEDLFFKGPWYSYPMGIGYMLSSNLTETILGADPSFPHHLNYPWDDVMIGGWIAALKEFHNPDADFETTLEHSPPPIRRVTPKPYLPYPIDTKVLDDKLGWHDFHLRGAWEQPIGWETSCVHRIRPKEMVAFRAMKEIGDEWERGTSDS